MELPARPPGAVDKRHLIPTIQEWPEYQHELVVDAYSLDTDNPNEKDLRVVTIGDRTKP